MQQGRRISRKSWENPANSQRSQKEYPQASLEREERSGLWMHPSEMDKPLGRESGDPLIDDITLDPALPPRYKSRGQIIDVYGQGGGFHLALSSDDLDLTYEQHLERPEDVFYLGSSPSLAGQLTTTRTTINEDAHEVVFPVPTYNGNNYLLFFEHVSRSPFRTFNIDRPNNIRLEQKAIWNSGGQTTIANNNYRIWFTRARMLPRLAGSTLYFGVSR